MSCWNQKVSILGHTYFIIIIGLFITSNRSQRSLLIRTRREVLEFGTTNCKHIPNIIPISSITVKMVTWHRQRKLLLLEHPILWTATNNFRISTTLSRLEISKKNDYCIIATDIKYDWQEYLRMQLVYASHMQFYEV